MPSSRSIIRAELKVVRSSRPAQRGEREEQEERSVPLRTGECECGKLRRDESPRTLSATPCVCGSSVTVSITRAGLRTLATPVARVCASRWWRRPAVSSFTRYVMQWQREVTSCHKEKKQNICYSFKMQLVTHLFLLWCKLT